MKTLYKYTNSAMCGWDFVLVNDRGTDGTVTIGNTASTAVNYQNNDLTVEVKTKKQLKAIVERLDWLGKYSIVGRV